MITKRGLQRIIIVFSLTFFSFSYLFCQDTPFSEIYEQINRLNLIGTGFFFDSSAHNSIEFSEKLDFKNSQRLFKNNNTTKYKYYLNDTELTRITYFGLNPFEIIVDFIVKSTDDYVFFTAYHTNPPDIENKNLVSGFFIYQKNTERIFYFDYLDIYDHKISINDICQVFILDKDLFPISKSFWKEQTFIFNSDFVYKDNIVMEEIYFASNQTDSIPHIGKLSLNEIYNVSKGYFTLDSEMKIYAYPYVLFNNPDIPLWLVSGSVYNDMTKSNR